MVFDDIEHDLEGPKASSDTEFGYLNRSNRPAAREVRNSIEAWICRYPAEKRPALISRLRSPISEAHLSAYFELFLHEWLLRTGHNIVEVEPLLAHTQRSPDFLVETTAGDRFFLEATLAVGKTPEELAADARLNSAIQEIERATAPNHFLSLNIVGNPASPVRISRLRRELANWIERLPEGQAARDATPFEYSEHGMRFTVTAFPRRAPAGGQARALGARSMEPRWAVPGDGVREAVSGKASRYGNLQAPYVVAVNMLGEYHNQEHAIDAMFGSPTVVITQYSDGRVETRDSRSGNGVWRGARGPRKRGLSAVITIPRLNPWSLGQRRAALIRNPWTTQLFPNSQLRTDEFNVLENELVRTEGSSLSEIFELPFNWPAHEE